jgi:SAM-dependent methyltransferase
MNLLPTPYSLPNHMQIQNQVNFKFSQQTQKFLCCPKCASQLETTDTNLRCRNNQCQTTFPVVNSIPILIDEVSSIFSISDFLDFDNATLKPKSKIERLIIDLLPGISLNLKAKQNFQDFAKILLKANPHPKVLVIGGSVVGQGIEALSQNPEIEIVEIDVAFGAGVSVICDAHSLPFTDACFDGVIVQAVLEHVVDPIRCVAEIHRVLKPNALVYAETPFMQQVHLGRYDFTRFTHLGHRRLFRKFAEVSSGAVCGPGMALAWSYQYLLLSLFENETIRKFVKIFARLTSFWLTYIDYLLINNPGVYDAASGYYFMGKKSDVELGDRELIKQYRGTQFASF